MTTTRAIPSPMPTQTARPKAEHTVIELRGDLGGATTATLRERLLHALHHSAPLLILDLSAVTRCAPPTLAVLVGTQRRAKLLGITLRLVAPRRDIAELLHRTGLDRSLTIHPTLTHALAKAGDLGGSPLH